MVIVNLGRKGEIEQGGRDREREKKKREGEIVILFFVYMLLRQLDTCSYINTHTP